MKYGWKKEDIISICLPKWDKYDNNKNKGKEIRQSIFIFFTKRIMRKDKNISSDYINNIIKLMNSNILNKKLIEKSISLYYSIHPGISNYKTKIKEKNLNLKYINNKEISDILMISSLLVTDFSSVIFDFIYQRKPFIIYISDSEDPNNKENYVDDYFNLINSINNGTIQIENKYNTIEQVINSFSSLGLLNEFFILNSKAS